MRKRAWLKATALGLAAAVAGGAAMGVMQAVSAAEPAATATAVVPVVPFRVLDTRNGTGTGGAVTRLGEGATIDVQMAGVGSVPADAVGVVLNVTGTRASAATYVTTWPTGQPRPNSSTLNLTPGIDSPNGVTALLGAGGKLSFYNNSGSTDLIADVTAYLAAGATGGQGPAGPQGPVGPQGVPGPIGPDGPGAIVIDEYVSTGIVEDLYVRPGLTVRGNCNGFAQVQFNPSPGYSAWFYGTKMTDEDPSISVRLEGLPQYSEATGGYMHIDGLLWIGSAKPSYYQISVQATDNGSECFFWIQLTPAATVV